MSTTTNLTPEEARELRMGFFEHLGELRDRVIRSFLALVLTTGIGFAFAKQGLELLRAPFCSLVETTRDCRFQLLTPTEGVIIYFRVSLLIGGILAIPMITYQLLMFILPGLTKKERRMVLLALPAITLLFMIGVLFAWYILLPPALGFLDQFLPSLLRPEWTADGYMSFVTALIFWMGVAFETPLVFFVLALMGFVTARGLAGNWRLAVVGSSIAAALITPTVDPVNLFLVMGPLLALYLLSIGLVYIGRRLSGLG